MIDDDVVEHSNSPWCSRVVLAPKPNGSGIRFCVDYRGINKVTVRDVHPLPSPGDLPNLIWQVARPGDVVVCLGAGNITAWAHALPGQLQQLAGDNAGPRAIANDHGPGTAA